MFTTKKTKYIIGALAIFVLLVHSTLTVYVFCGNQLYSVMALSLTLVASLLVTYAYSLHVGVQKNCFSQSLSGDVL
jgi:hypothetical protein